MSVAEGVQYCQFYQLSRMKTEVTGCRKRDIGDCSETDRRRRKLDCSGLKVYGEEMGNDWMLCLKGLLVGNRGKLGKVVSVGSYFLL